MALKVRVPTLTGPCYPRCTPTYGPGGPLSHRLASGLIPGPVVVAGNGLLNNLIAYWPGQEPLGNLQDLHTNALHLTDINTVTSNPGHVYAAARQYTLANNEYHARASDPLLVTGNVDFTLATWCYLDTKAASTNFFCKWAVKREYLVGYSTAPIDRFNFTVRDAADAANTTENADQLGAVSTSTWYLVIARHDSVANKIYIQVNNGTPDEGNFAGGVNTDTETFSIGAMGAGAIPINGRIGPSAMWKSAAGAGGVLTAAQRTALWNGGAGLTYAEFDSG